LLFLEIGFFLLLVTVLFYAYCSLHHSRKPDLAIVGRRKTFIHEKYRSSSN
jgi:hypothetical protein